jgi:hypothetical protein
MMGWSARVARGERFFGGGGRLWFYRWQRGYDHASMGDSKGPSPELTYLASSEAGVLAVQTPLFLRGSLMTPIGPATNLYRLAGLPTGVADRETTSRNRLEYHIDHRIDAL